MKRVDQRQSAVSTSQHEQRPISLFHGVLLALVQKDQEIVRVRWCSLVVLRSVRVGAVGAGGATVRLMDTCVGRIIRLMCAWVSGCR
jgi:hypothetical protein